MQAQFLTPGSAFPPPFHLIYLLARSVFRCKRQGQKSKGMKQTLEKKQNYFQLLQRLLQLKQYRDSHKTEVDKLTDLRKDLYEKLTEKYKLWEEKKKDENKKDV